MTDEMFEIAIVQAEAVKRGVLTIWTVYERPRDYPTVLQIGPKRPSLSTSDLPSCSARSMLISFHPIAILRGWACLALGKVRVRTPSSRLALIFSRSTLFESVNERA